jgi:fatty-acyl-CoA synthase
MGASETGAQASHLSAKGAVSTGRFSAGPGAVVLTEGLDALHEPGHDGIGWLGQSGWIPLGYLGDQEKTGRTFPVIGGVRYAVPGDRARLLGNGDVEVLGRDSVTINTGGEKVFAEEVEEVIKRYPGVLDAVCVGIPDDRFGHVVTALVEVDGDHRVERDELRSYVSDHLAAYKAPRVVIVVPSIGRSPAGKVDYARLGNLAQSTFEQAGGDGAKTLVATEN